MGDYLRKLAENYKQIQFSPNINVTEMARDGKIYIAKYKNVQPAGDATLALFGV
jgi:hypothetical protein